MFISDGRLWGLIILHLVALRVVFIGDDILRSLYSIKN
jgi:hypothetical protein